MRGIKALTKNLDIDLRDCIATGGLAALGTGVGFIYWPAALVVVGIVLLYMAHGGVKRRGNSQ